MASTYFLSIISRSFSTFRVRKSTTHGAVVKAGGRFGDFKSWQCLSACVAVPALGLCMLKAMTQKKAVQARNDPVEYDYLCRHEKHFPWADGNKTFVRKPKKNAWPEDGNALVFGYQMSI